MFIQCRSHNMPVLINVNTIQAIIPMDDGSTCSIRVDRVDGIKFFELDLPFDKAQEVLIDCAAQVTAPIAIRLNGLDNMLNHIRPTLEKLLESFNKPLLNTDGLTPEELARFKSREIESAMWTLETIQPASNKVWLQPGIEYDREHLRDQFVKLQNVNDDVGRAVSLLRDNEYAEHWAVSAAGQRLESEITRLVGHDNEQTNRLKRAEELLAGVHHVYENDGIISKADAELMKEVSDFLYPDPVAALDLIGSQTARDLLDE